MSRHNYAQIPVAEAHDDLGHHASSSLSTSSSPQPSLQQQQHQHQTSSEYPRSSPQPSSGYTALQHTDDEDEEEPEHEEHDAFLGQSHPLASTASSSRFLADEITLAPPSSSTPASSSRASTPASTRRVIGSSNDGVFANLSAKPRVEKEVKEELPPPYKQAAMDATPAYYETTVNAPDFLDDDVLVEGLPVGNIYGFIWNFVVSMSFQFVGFFLTYLLHTSHSTKNGSKAGLGVTFISMGIQMMNGEGLNSDEDADTGYMYNAGQSIKAMTEYIWLSYILLVLGTFLVVRSIYDFARVKRTEMIINATSSRATADNNATRGNNSEDDAVAATLAYIDLEAGLAAAARANNEASSSTISATTAAASSSSSSTPSANTPPEPAGTNVTSTPSGDDARRDRVITLLV